MRYTGGVGTRGAKRSPGNLGEKDRAKQTPCDMHGQGRLREAVLPFFLATVQLDVEREEINS